MTILQEIAVIAGNGIQRALDQVRALETRMSSAETEISLLGAQVPAPVPGLTAQSVTWTNLSEINLSGEKLVNNDFSAYSYVQDPNFCLLQSCGLQPNNNHQYNHTFAVADRPKVIALQTNSGLTQDTIYEIITVNTSSGNAQIGVIGGSSIGWIAGRGTTWEVVNLGFDNWTVTSGTLDESKLTQGIVKGDGGQVSIQQNFSQNIAQGTNLIIKITSTDTIKVYPITDSGTVDTTNSFDVLPSNGLVEHTTQTIVSGFRISTVASSREYSSVSVFQGAVSGGTMQVHPGSGLEKIAGTNTADSGASSTQYIPGNSNGYAQFQWASGAVRIGLSYADEDYTSADIDPFRMFIASNGDLTTADATGTLQTVSANSFFRIRHYADTNTVVYQMRDDIYQANASIQPSTYVASQSDLGTKIVFLKTSGMGSNGGVNFQVTLNRGYEVANWSTTNNQFMVVDDGGLNMWLPLNNSSSPRNRGDAWEFGELLGQDYLTFHTSSTSSNGNDMYIDTTFQNVGGRINDAIIAT